MQRASSWYLPLLILTMVACGPGSGEGEATASTESPAGVESPASTETAVSEAPSREKPPEPAAIADPREPKEVWPLVLAQRDRVRALMGRSEAWHEDLEQLEAEILTLLRLVGEVAEWVKQNPSPEVDSTAVARSRGDVRVAVSPIRAAIQAKAPGMWRFEAPRVDQALRLMEKRFPNGLGESIADRPDYAKQLGETS